MFTFIFRSRGLDNAGKSTVVARWLGENVHQVAPTFGFVIKTLSLNPYCIHLWDIGGQRSIRPFWRNYFEETDGIVFVIDSAAPHRFQESVRELTELLAQDRLANASLLILANKQDSRGALEVTTMEDQLMLVGALGDKSGRTHWAMRGCAALMADDQRAKDALEWLVNDIGRRLYHVKDSINIQ